jgi:tRNA pseudouridine55 synthase
VRVDGWELLAWREGEDVVADVRVTCGGGTYVRSLARDLARATGSAAHLTALHRVRSGAFDVADAVSLDRLREGGVPLRPPLDALPEHPVQALDAADVRRVLGGIQVTATVDGAWGALVDADGALIALAERAGERWQPRVVLHG